MSTESYLEAPHYRHPTGGTQSSVEYEAGEESSASSMDNHTAAGYKNNSVSSLGYPHDVAKFDARSKRSAHQQHHSQALPSQLQLQPQHAFSNSSQPLSGFATPQSSPHSPGGSPQRSTHDGKAFPYSSGSEDDHEALPSQEPPLLGDLPRAGPYRPRRDSGAPPIKMAAAKRLPPFNNGLSSIPAELHVTEEQEEEDLEGRAHRSDYHENGVDSMPHHDEEQQPLQMSDRDKDPREASNISKAAVNGGLTQSSTRRSSFHPFPSPPTRTVPATASHSTTSAAHSHSSEASALHDDSRTPQPVIRPQEPDRGPADLSNPSMALAEALIAARSKAEFKPKSSPQQQLKQLTSTSSRPSSHGDKQSPSSPSGPDTSFTSGGQIRIPVPDLSPSLRGYPSHGGRQQSIERNPEGLLYDRRTSFTLSPTSSNPELAESDSHSGSYGTPRPHTNGGPGSQHSTTSSAKYVNVGSRAVGPSISSTMSRFSDDYQQQPRHQHHSQLHPEPTVLGTSYDSANSVQQEGHTYSRYAYPTQELESGSLPSQGYTESLQHSSVGNGTQGQYGSSLESAPHRYPGQSKSSKSFQKQRLQDQKQSARTEPSGSAAAHSYPATHSSHSLGASEDLQDQLTTEAEYIMNRNTELLRILSIRDEEIQTLQQELDHTLKVMHEYEDDLMAMHTAAAKPYESYHQTLDQIGHEMTQQEALVKGYQQENEKLTTQLKSSVELRQEGEKRHLQSVDRLKNEIAQLRSELDSSDQEKYGNADLRVLLKQSQESHERTRKSLNDKEEEHQAEISDLKERLRLTEQVLDEERKAKVEDMQKLERDIQDFRAGYDGMMAQLQSINPSYQTPHLKHGSSSSSGDDGLADTTVDMEIERDIGLIKASLLKSDRSSALSKYGTPSPAPSNPQQDKRSKHKPLDRKLTSTETLTTANMPDATDMDKMDLEQRISKFEADVRQSLMRSGSIESIISNRSSAGTSVPLASHIKSQQHQNGGSREDIRLSNMGDERKLANKLRDRINTLNVENKRLHKELSSLSLLLRQQQAERQRKVSQLEELLDMHETMANQRLEDGNTDEGQTRIRKVIQGLLVRIRTKEAEAEFYHNAYLDKVLELDQMALTNGKHQIVEQHLEGHSQAVVDGLSVGATPTHSIEALETHVKELERINMETAFRLAAEQRRAQSAESEKAALIRDKLTMARMLEDQVDQLQSKLSAAEIAKAKLQDENSALRQQGSKDKQQHRMSQGERSNPDSTNSSTNAESMAIMRTRMLSLTQQRDQLREQLQEAFEIQRTMQDRSAGGVPEWTVDDFKRIEKALEEKSSELSVWKERAIALEKVVERIRMIKDKPEPTGLSLERSSTRDSDSVASSSASGRHHTLEELDQVVLRLEQRLERRDQELQEVVLEAKRQTDQRLEAWKAKWVQVVQRKNAEIHRFQVELESLMAAVDRDRARMAVSMKK